MTEREQLIVYRIEYMMWGDLDKPFHRSECECERCEAWRVARNRPTHKELREMDRTDGEQP